MVERRRVHVVVSGRVQGVWFRETTRRVADAVGATGWVRNTPRGTVEVEIQGTPEAVERVVAFTRTGPPRAQVTAVEVQPVDPVDTEVGFRLA